MDPSTPTFTPFQRYVLPALPISILTILGAIVVALLWVFPGVIFNMGKAYYFFLGVAVLALASGGFIWSFLSNQPMVEKMPIRFQLGGMSCVVVGTILFMVVSLENPARSAITSANLANQKVEMATELLGRETAIAGQVREATASYESFTQNREFVDSIAYSTTSDKVLVDYLTASSDLGIDPSFVRENGLVRAEDSRALLSAALEQSAQGNLVATRWAAAIAQR